MCTQEGAAGLLPRGAVSAAPLPSVVGHGGVRSVLDTPMDDGELASLHHSAETLQQSLATLGI